MTPVKGLETPVKGLDQQLMDCCPELFSERERTQLSTPQKSRMAFNELCKDIRTTPRRKHYIVLDAMQRKMKPGEIECVKIEDTARLFVFNGGLTRIDGFLAKGGNSKVSKGREMTFVRKVGHSPSKLLPRAIKRSRRRMKGGRNNFDTEKKRLENALPPNSKDSIYIDHYLRVGKSKSGRAISLHELFDGTLNKIRYSYPERSVKFLVESLLDNFKGLSLIHRGGSIHRDIKPDNMLMRYKKKEGQSRGALTDMGFLMKAPTNKHRTAGTVTYMSPAIWPNFDAQVARRGVQTPTDDLFALGRTITELLMNLLNRVKFQKENSKYEEFPSLLEEIDYTVFPHVKGSEFERLFERGRRDPNHVFFNGNLQKKEGTFYTFLPAPVRYDKMNRVIEKTRNIFTPVELKALQLLNLLARELQDLNRERVPTTKQTLDKLSFIYNLFEQSAPIVEARSERDSDSGDSLISLEELSEEGKRTGKKRERSTLFAHPPAKRRKFEG